ncbi:MAG: hypothetical protein ABI603_07735 [Acidobacteriota bacterium]
MPLRDTSHVNPVETAEGHMHMHQVSVATPTTPTAGTGASAVSETHPLFLLWVALQRPGKHFLVRCEPRGFEALAELAEHLCAPPVRVCRLPGRLRLPRDHGGTLLLNDVAALALGDQIALYDWLSRPGSQARVIAGTSSSPGSLIGRGRFLEGLFNRLNDVQFDLTSGGGARS